MQIPLTVARRHYAQQIISTCNQSGLPAFVMLDVISDIQRELARVANEEYARDEAAYRQACEAEKQKEQDKKENEDKVGE